MAKAETKVAKRYARALFETCAASNYESVSAALTQLSSSLEDPAIRSALLNPSLSSQQRSAWITDLATSLCPDESKALGNLFSLLIQNRRVDSIPALSEFFAQLLANYKKLLELEVTSAKDLSDSEKQELSQKIKSKMPAELADGVSFDWKFDAEILGGLQVRVGDKLLDGSVSGAINKIARQLRE